MSGDIKTTQVSLPHSATGINSEDPAPAQETDLHEIQEKETEDIQVDNYNENEYITGLQLLTVMASLTVVAFVLMLDTTILSTAVPVITNDFGSLTDIGWYTSAYLLSICALQPLSGKIYQHYNSKVSFISAVLLFELGSLISGLATSSNMFIVGRAVAGMGSAGLLNGALTIISASAPLDKRPALLGILIGCSSMGLVLGPIIGGALADHVGWRWCFYINVPMGGVIAIVLFFVRIPDASIKSKTRVSLLGQLRRLDLEGFFIFAPAIIMLLLALEWGGVNHPWNSAMIIGLFCGSICALGIFFVWEHFQGETAMIPISMLKNSIVSSAGTVNFFMNGSQFLLASFLPLWFQVVKNVSPTTSGIYYLPSVGGQIIGSIVSGYLISKLGRYTPFAIGGTAILSIGTGLMTTFTINSIDATWICYQIIAGTARGVITQIPIIAVQAALPKKQVAIGTALMSFFQPLGGTVFTTIGQTVLLNELPKALAIYAPEVDAAAVIATGATNFRTVVGESSVDGVVSAYNKAITTTLYLALGGSLLAFVASFGLGWTNLRAKKEETIESEG